MEPTDVHSQPALEMTRGSTRPRRLVATALATLVVTLVAAACIPRDATQVEVVQEGGAEDGVVRARVIMMDQDGNVIELDGDEAMQWIEGENNIHIEMQELGVPGVEFIEGEDGERRVFLRQLGQPDVVHAHNYFCPSHLDSARLVYTSHYLAFVHHPEWTTEENRALCYRGVFEASLRADAIAAVSEATRRDWLDLFPHYPADRVHVMPLASRMDQQNTVRPPRGTLRGLGPRAFLLTVATLEPRKNPIRLLRAYSAYRTRVAEPMPLVWAGARGWLCDAFDAEVEALDLTDHVLLRLLHRAHRHHLSL